MNADSRQSALRILDANLNRATEALRVAEDICRFHWNLPDLAKDLKGLRHDLFGAMSTSTNDRTDRLRARDIDGDVGRANRSPAADVSLPQLAHRNLGRAREALRTLEEVSRAALPKATLRLEALRYELYAVEKAIGRLSQAGAGQSDALRGQLARVHLYLLATSALCRLPLARAVEQVIRAGCGAVQLREKGMSDRALLPLARELRAITARTDALFIVNDRPDIARLVHADGVHLGQADLPIPEARELVGDNRLIGVSTHSVDQARTAQRQGADYIGVGPAFSTGTKPEAGLGLGPDRVGAIAAQVSIPTFAIGGIDAERAAALAGTACQGVAVSSAILAAASPAEAAQAMVERFKS